MPTATASVDVSNLMARMSRYQAQFPFALASALTKTAKDAQPVVRTLMQQVFDRPTPYTLNSTYITPAKKSDPTPSADVFFKNETSKGTPAAKYIFPEVYGGERNVKRFERALRAARVLPAGMVTMPGGGAKLDQYGNIPASMYSLLLSQLGASPDEYQNQTVTSKAKRGRRLKRGGNYFVLRARRGKLPPGIYERFAFGFGSAVKPIIVFVSRANYSKRLPFAEAVAGVFEKQFYPNFDAALARAIATARDPA